MDENIYRKTDWIDVQDPFCSIAKERSRVSGVSRDVPPRSSADLERSDLNLNETDRALDFLLVLPSPERIFSAWKNNHGFWMAPRVTQLPGRPLDCFPFLFVFLIWSLVFLIIFFSTSSV